MTPSVFAGSCDHYIGTGEKREFDLLEKEIADLEQEKSALGNKLEKGKMDYNELQQTSARIGEISQLIEKKELRWLELSEMAG